MDTEETTAIATPVPRDVVAIARNPAEMAQAQELLVKWATENVVAEQTSLDDLQENLRVATKNKWRTASLRRAVTKARKMVNYYTKIKAALDAGYCIVPNFPVDIFAIRTTKKTTTNVITPHADSTQLDQKTNSPPIGDGEYKCPEPTLDHWEEEKKNSHNDGTHKVQRYVPDAFLEPSFPFTFAKTQILDETAKAMALKVFDELGVLPARRRKGDPMVVGRILVRDGYNEKAISFLVAWFMRREDM
jgi:hypothetical protein